MKAVVISVSGVARNGSRARKTPQNRARKILTRDMFGGPLRQRRGLWKPWNVTDRAQACEEA